jgi:hypothetical protein
MDTLNDGVCFGFKFFFVEYARHGVPSMVEISPLCPLRAEWRCADVSTHPGILQGL